MEDTVKVDKLGEKKNDGRTINGQIELSKKRKSGFNSIKIWNLS